MAERVEVLILGLWNTMTATAIGYFVVRGELAPGWVFFAAVSAFCAVATAAKLGALSASDQKRGKG